jgi:hypothetical protein
MGRTIALLGLAGALSCAAPLTPLPLAGGGDPSPDGPAPAASLAASPSELPAQIAAPFAASPAASAAASAATPPAPPPRRPTSATLRLRHAPFGEQPRAFVHATDSLAELDEVPIVVFFHGWHGCIEVVVSSQDAPCTPGKQTRFAMDLKQQFDRAGVRALLVVPQLPFDQPSSAPGMLSVPGFFRDMLEEILGSPELEGVIPAHRRIGRVILAGHSGAYRPLGRALGRGGVNVHEVWMLDAFYETVPELRTWYRSHEPEFSDPPRRRLVFLYTTSEQTGPRTLGWLRRLAPGKEGAGLFVGEAPVLIPDSDLASPLVAQHTGVAHERIPREAFAPLLRTARLPPLR